VPFGPEISWPNGFRQLDPESRRLLESGYGSGGYSSGGYGSGNFGSEGLGSGNFGSEGLGSGSFGSEGLGSEGYGGGQYGHVDPGYGTSGHGSAGYGGGSGYRQPAMEDLGYGDPGYSDPAYDGPRSPYGGHAAPGGNWVTRAPGGSSGLDDGGYGRRLGYHGPEFRESSYPEPGPQQWYVAPPVGPDDIYPVTGGQQALPGTGPQRIAESWAGGDYGSPAAGSQGYPEQWYDHPRLADPWADGSQAGGPRPDGPQAPDPRLAGMRYDQLHYEEPSFGQPGYDEPLDDEAWDGELRHNAPAYPQSAADQHGPDPRAADPRRYADPRGPGHGPQPGHGYQSGHPQPPGHGPQPGYPQAPAHEPPFGYGPARDDRGNPGPRMSAGRETSPGSWPDVMSGTDADLQPGPAAPSGLAVQDVGYLGAPTAQVGVLTPPATTLLDDPADGGLLTAPVTGELLAPLVRPGHGLDGPEITASWPTRPQADELDSFEEFWREDDKDGGYPGLFPPDDGHVDELRDTGGLTSGRRTGRRRGRSNDRRLWLALIGVIITAAAAIFGIIKFEFPSHGGPAHTMATPAQIGTYVRTMDLERQTHLAELRAEVIKMSSGQASGVVSAVYESGDSAAGSTEQIVMLIEGHLANAAPAASIASFTQKFPGATVVNAGSLGGKAACVENGAGTSDPVSMCAWFDNDSFGEIVSPTMNATSLGDVMRTLRPSVELVAKK
jgi:hypothetical protein